MKSNPLSSSSIHNSLHYSVLKNIINATEQYDAIKSPRGGRKKRDQSLSYMANGNYNKKSRTDAHEKQYRTAINGVGSAYHLRRMKTGDENSQVINNMSMFKNANIDTNIQNRSTVVSRDNSTGPLCFKKSISNRSLADIEADSSLVRKHFPILPTLSNRISPLNSNTTRKLKNFPAIKNGQNDEILTNISIIKARPEPSADSALEKSLKANSQSFKSRPRTCSNRRSSTKNMIINNEVEGISNELMKKLYQAKCQDLMINPKIDQEKRFFEYCRQNIINRKFNLRENGLGLNSAKVLAQILKGNDSFAQIDLRKNMFGNEGVIEVMKGVKANVSLVHLDLGSNDLTAEGATFLFDVLATHKSLTSLSISNTDGLHRNRIGAKGATSIGQVLKENKILGFLNLADNGIGTDGLKAIAEGLEENHSLMSLNLNNNDLPWDTFRIMAKPFERCKLKELRLSSNKLNDKTIEDLASIFSNMFCLIEILDLSHNDISSIGLSKLLTTPKACSNLKSLNLESNDFSHYLFSEICYFLRNNKVLDNLNISNCSIDYEGEGQAIGDGLLNNFTLRTLIVAGNKIENEGAISIARALNEKVCNLRVLDLSGNEIEDEGCMHLIRSLKDNVKVETLLLKNNRLYDESGQAICSLLNQNKTLTKVCLEKNSMKVKYQLDVDFLCTQNREFNKKNVLPRFKDELHWLRQKVDTNDMAVVDLENLKKKQEHVRMQIAKDEIALEKIRAIEDKGLKELEIEAEKFKAIFSKLKLEEDKAEDEFKKKEEVMKDLFNDNSYKLNTMLDSVEKLEVKSIYAKKDLTDSKKEAEKKFNQFNKQLEDIEKDREMSELLYKNYKKEVEKLKKSPEEALPRASSFMLPKGESPCRRHSLSTIYESPDRQLKDTQVSALGAFKRVLANVGVSQINVAASTMKEHKMCRDESSRVKGEKSKSKGPLKKKKTLKRRLSVRSESCRSKKL